MTYYLLPNSFPPLEWDIHREGVPARYSLKLTRSIRAVPHTDDALMASSAAGVSE